MTEELQPPGPPPRPTAATDAEKRARKKKEKVRSAWISFAGRIVAQVLGAIATVVLGLFVLQKSVAQRAPDNGAGTGAAAAIAGKTPTQHRPTDEISLAAL